MMELFLFWLLSAIAAGMVASSKGRNGFGWFLLSLLLFGVLGLLIVGFLPSVKPASASTASAEKRVPCPRCKEQIVDGASVCRFCGHEIVPESVRVETPRLWDRRR